LRVCCRWRGRRTRGDGGSRKTILGLSQRTQTAQAKAKDREPIELPDRIGIFSQRNLSLGQIDHAGIHPDASPRPSSLSTGVDYRLTSDAIIGIAGNTTGIGGGSQTSSDAFNLTLYGTMRPVDAAYIDAQLSYGMVKFDARRNVATIDVIAEGKPNG
jgi:hypothetical protein